LGSGQRPEKVEYLCLKRFFMKTKDLNLLELKELKEKDVKMTNGGWISLALAIAGATIYIYNNKDDFAEGFKEGFNS